MTEFNFDKLARFRALDALIDALPELVAGSWAILDVGGYPGDFADYCAGRRRVTTADLPPCDRPDYVQASGDDLPFADGEFAAVVSSDTLEHIQPEKRTRFLAECLRCAERGVIIGCPWGHPVVASAEEALRGFHAMLYPAPHPWLDEHGRHGLPEMDATLAALRAAGAADAAAIPSLPLRPWFYHQAWSILGGAFAALGAMPDAAAALFKDSPAMLDEAGPPFYRLFYVAVKSGEIPASLRARSEAAAKVNMNLFEDEMGVLREIAQAFRSGAGALKALLANEGAAAPSASTDAAYAKRLEGLINKTTGETERLRRALTQSEKRQRRLTRHPLFRLLRRLGLLPKND